MTPMVATASGWQKRTVLCKLENKILLTLILYFSDRGTEALTPLLRDCPLSHSRL